MTTNDKTQTGQAHGDSAVKTAELDDETKARVEELAAAVAPQRPPLVEPEEDELGDDLVFVRNGWLRVTIDGTEYKLRRPFLGELRDLDLSREADTEALRASQRELHETTSALLERARAIEIEARSLSGEEPERKQALDLEATQLGLTAQKASAKFVREGQDRRAKWWEQVFEQLTPLGRVKPNKSQYPAWIGDVTVQQRVIEHWQTSPLARGGG